jgi:CBS-domain-containing membrane protein
MAATPANIEYLSSILLDDVVNHKKELVRVDATDSLATAITRLQENDILSVAVYDKAAHLYLGILDMSAIMFFLVYGKFKRDVQNPSTVTVNFNLDHARTSVRDILGVSEEGSAAWMFGSCQTLWEVLGPFTKGVHRAVISCVENSQDVHRMLTQTDILRWALQHRQQLQPWPLAGTFRSVFGARAGNSVVTVTTEETALEAYRHMWASGVTSVGVVDPTSGRLVASLSPSDLRGLGPSRIAELLLPVLTFIRACSSKSQCESPVAVGWDSSIAEAVEKAITGRSHRVWILDEQQRPVNVISFSDMLSLFRPRHARGGHTPTPASVIGSAIQAS